MSGIGKSVTLAIGARKVVCSELTVAQVRQLLQREVLGDLVDEALFTDVRLPDLPLFTGLTVEEIDQMLPSEIEEIVAGCKEANPAFFRMLAALSKQRQPA